MAGTVSSLHKSVPSASTSTQTWAIFCRLALPWPRILHHAQATISHQEPQQQPHAAVWMGPI